MRAEAIRLLVAMGVALLAAGPRVSAEETKPTPGAPVVADSSMSLKGNEEGTVLKSLTIEGEDRVRVEFERPALSLDLDPLDAPGLDWDFARDAFVKCDVDFVSPLTALSAVERSPYLARPWLDAFVSGDVVRFQPALKDVDRWRLAIADSRGREVASFEGKGSPPREIGWNGRSSDGSLMPPGLTYSYVVEAFDRAGNKRNFVGKGFDLPPYEIAAGSELVLMFAGKGLISAAPAGGRKDDPRALLLDAASRINQTGRADGVIQVAVSARTYREADDLAKNIASALGPLLLGDPARIKCLADVQPDAPAGGTVAIRAER